jgi:hypothetical protein
MPKSATLDAQKAAILTRAIQPDQNNLPVAAARALLRFQLAPGDRERLHQLLQKNQEGPLTGNEHGLLEDYLQIGMLLDLLKAKARSALRRTGERSNRAHG